MENKKNTKKRKFLLPIEQIQKEKSERIWKQAKEQYKEQLGKKPLEECFSEQLRKENEKTIIKETVTLSDLFELDFNRSCSDSKLQETNDSSHVSSNILLFEAEGGESVDKYPEVKNPVDNSYSSFSDSTNLTMDNSRSFSKPEHLYYDIICDDNESKKCDLKFKEIDEDHKYYIYENKDMNTSHSLIIGTKFGKGEKSKKKNINAKKDPKSGISFCSKDISNYPGEKEEMLKCSPEHLCRNCLKINQENYGLPRHYLINSIGRVCKIYKKNKEKNEEKNEEPCFECYGHFLENGKENICSHSYTCASCEQMNKNYTYYFDEGAIKKILAAK